MMIDARLSIFTPLNPYGVRKSQQGGVLNKDQLVETSVSSNNFGPGLGCYDGLDSFHHIILGQEEHRTFNIGFRTADPGGTGEGVVR